MENVENVESMEKASFGRRCYRANLGKNVEKMLKSSDRAVLAANPQRPTKQDGWLCGAKYAEKMIGLNKLRIGQANILQPRLR